MSTLSIKAIKKIIESTDLEHKKFVDHAEIGERYYRSENDILKRKMPQDDEDNPRNSNWRLSSKLYHLLVEQKWSFMFKNKFKFLTHYKESDTEDEDIVHYNDPEHTHSEKSKAKKLDKEIREIMGNTIDAEIRDVTINACNTGRGWIHYWKTGSHLGEDEDKGQFKYASINPKEIHAEWGNSVDRELLWLLRQYEYRDPTDGELYIVYEFWDKQFCYCYRKKENTSIKYGLHEYPRFWYYSTDLNDYDKTHIYKHGFDRVPFICFKNNELETSDLDGIKGLIDAYDLVNSQFINDEEDFQKMIFILTGYGAEPPDDFLERLKRKKLVKLESNYPEKSLQPSLETLAIEIPVEAYEKSIETTKNAIYEQGMGLDITDDKLSYTSGEALDFKYSLLELKCAATKVQFEKGFCILIKEIAKHLGYKDIDETLIEIRWNDGKVRNITDMVNNARLCLNFTSLKTALEANPLVNDVDEEIRLIEREKQEQMNMEAPMMDNTRSNYYSRSNWNYNRYNNQSSGYSNNRQNDYQINRSQSEIKSKQPEKYTMAQKGNNQTQVRK